MHRLHILNVILGFVSPAMVHGGDPGACPDCVIVAIDMDATVPGLQATRVVPTGTTAVSNVALWIYDPAGAATIYSIGYVGGLNRGIAMGHQPDVGNSGAVVAIAADSVAPVVGGHAAFVNGGTQTLFDGPELQYFESGVTPGPIPDSLMSPAVTCTIQLADAAEGDIFRFYVGDMTTVWQNQFPPFTAGAFSTTALGSLDAGGDAVADGTPTAYGVDPDTPQPSPPAPFAVDYVDGPSAVGARIIVAASVPAVSSLSFGALAFGLIIGGGIIIRRRSATPCHQDV
jgi:hypothetical protein